MSDVCFILCYFSGTNGASRNSRNLEAEDTYYAMVSGYMEPKTNQLPNKIL